MTEFCDVHGCTKTTVAPGVSACGSCLYGQLAAARKAALLEAALELESKAVNRWTKRNVVEWLRARAEEEKA